MSRVAKSAFLSLLVCSSIWAQGDRGTVRGTVKDATGAIVPNASVTATNTATNVATKTTSGATTGDYTIPSLPVGTYRVRVDAPGFKAFVQEAIALAAGDTVTVDAVLQVGAATETVDVTSDITLLQTDTARTASQVSTTFVNDLPLVINGGVRSPFDLAATTAEIQGASGSYRVGGGEANREEITLDGATATSVLANQGQSADTAPSIDALAEFNVEGGGFKAEEGHMSGGAVSFVSKSGTNQLHGDLYEFFRNYDMDARGFFAVTKPILKQNDFGATAGGPVYIPKVYNGKNRSFWFLSYEGFRNRVGATATPLSVPPPPLLQGNFTDWVNSSGKQYTIYDPNSQTYNAATGTYSRTAFPGNIIPASRIDPVAQAIVNYAAPLVVPNAPNLIPGTSGYVRNNYIIPSTALSLDPNNKLSIKADQKLTEKQRMSFYYGQTKVWAEIGPNGGAGLPEPLFGSNGFVSSNVYRGSHDYVISPTLVNRAYFGVTLIVQQNGAADLVQGSPLTQGLPLTNSKPFTSTAIPNWPDNTANFPQVAFTGDGFTTWGVSDTNGSNDGIYEIRDDLTKVHGKHTFKVGFFYNDSEYDGYGTQNASGNVTFNYLSTSVPLATSETSGSAFASFLLGQDYGYSLDTPRYLISHWVSQAAYAQDDWRISNKLTVNLGVRWEIDHPPTVDNNKQSNLCVTCPNPDAGGLPGALQFAGSGPGRTGSRTMTQGWQGAAPRFGFAYSVNNKTTIRGSASEGFGPVEDESNSSHYLGFLNRITVSNTSQGLSPTFILQNGAPAYPGEPGQPSLPDLDPGVGNGVNAPYYGVGQTATAESQEFYFTFNIQRQLSQTLALDVGYNGTMAGRLQSALLDYNALNFAALPASLSPFTAAGRTLLTSLVGSAAANAAGIAAPWSGFNALWATNATVEQALVPFPMYSYVDTVNGGGDRIGHSTYNALIVKLTKHLSHGFTLQGNYVFSKYLTDADSSGPEDPFDRQLEKALSPTDQTHVAKVSYTYDLPVGKGRQFLNRGGVVDEVLGGWRLSGLQSYASGTPIAITTTVQFPLGDLASASTNRPTITTYSGWRPTYTGAFNPVGDSFFQPASFFGTQSTTAFGNATRTNPLLRNFANLTENISLAKTFAIHESIRAEFRAESFNVLNRTLFGPVSTSSLSLENASFGNWAAQANTARQLQLALKLYF